VPLPDGYAIYDYTYFASFDVIFCPFLTNFNHF
jgi:hypothetical protein